MKRLRRPVSLLVCLAFLWMQVAVAAFACDSAPHAAPAAQTAPACHGADPAPPADPRCQPHCHPQPPMPDSAKLPVFAPIAGSAWAGALPLRLPAQGEAGHGHRTTAPHASPPLLDLYAHRLI